MGNVTRAKAKEKAGRKHGQLFKASLIMKSWGGLNPWSWRYPLWSCRYLPVVCAQIGENENDKSSHLDG